MEYSEIVKLIVDVSYFVIVIIFIIWTAFYLRNLREQTKTIGKHLKSLSSFLGLRYDGRIWVRSDAADNSWSLYSNNKRFYDLLKFLDIIYHPEQTKRYVKGGKSIVETTPAHFEKITKSETPQKKKSKR